VTLSSHQSARAKSTTYLTPREILAPLGAFDLDPCAAPSPRPWPTADRHIELPENGLAAEWTGRVWCNPPFGREAAAWLAKMALHGNGIALVPARTETAMFYRSVWGMAAGMLFLRGRPHFCAGADCTVRHGSKTIHVRWGERFPFNSGAPIALIAYGESNASVLQRSGLGHFLWSAQ
jgi:hypothetical protein